MVSLLLNVLCIFYQKLILINFQLISLLSEVQSFLLSLTESSFKVINVSSQLSWVFSILACVLNAHLQLLIVADNLIDFFLMTPLDITYRLFIFHLLWISLSLAQLIETLRLKVTIAHFVKLQGFWINLESVLVFQVFLNTHTKNVRINR